jgi:hypothetical protein
MNAFFSGWDPSARDDVIPRSARRPRGGGAVRPGTKTNTTSTALVAGAVAACVMSLYLVDTSGSAIVSDSSAVAYTMEPEMAHRVGEAGAIYRAPSLARGAPVDFASGASVDLDAVLAGVERLASQNGESFDQLVANAARVVDAWRSTGEDPHWPDEPLDDEV